MIPEAHLSTCFGAIYGTLAFTMAGFSYPVTSMPPALQALSQLFPLRHYYKAVSGVSLFGNGLEMCWVQVCALLLFWIAGVIGIYRLKKQEV